MSWAMQALHVARKDVRHARWSLAVYGVIVAAALVHAVSLPGAPNQSNPFSAVMFVLVLFGTILAATAVQADSPTQSNAFWASRPFHPTAMLGAKVLYCGCVVLGVPLLAEAIGLMRFNAPLDVAMGNLAQSVAIYGLILLCTIIVASLTSDIRGFIVGSLVLVVGLALVVAVSSSPLPYRLSSENSLRWVYLATAIVTGGGLLVWLYRRRDISRLAWVGATVAVAAGLASISTIDQTPARREVPAALRTAHFSLDQVNVESNVSGQHIGIRFRVDNAPSSARVVLRIDSAFVRLRDGSRIAAAPSYLFMPLESGSGSLPAGVHAFGSVAGAPTLVGTTLRFDESARSKLSQGITSVDVHARAIVSEARALASTPIGTPLETDAAGARFRISDNFGRGERNAITVTAATIADGDALNGNGLGVALINDALHEGLVLNAQNYANSSDWLVLPGSTIRTAFVHFNTERPTAEGNQTMSTTITGFGTVSESMPSPRVGPFPDPSWYKNGRIVVLQWITRGEYAVHLTKDVQ